MKTIFFYTIKNISFDSVLSRDPNTKTMCTRVRVARCVRTVYGRSAHAHTRTRGCGRYRRRYLCILYRLSSISH